jgi:hypothetical protein
MDRLTAGRLQRYIERSSWHSQGHRLVGLLSSVQTQALLDQGLAAPVRGDTTTAKRGSRPGEHQQPFPLTRMGGADVGLTVHCRRQLALRMCRAGPTSVRRDYLFAKMLMSGQFTMKPVLWKVLLVLPLGVMLWACVPTGASARRKWVCRKRLASGTETFYCRKWMSHIGL